MRVLALLNGKAGTATPDGDVSARVARAFAAAGIDADVRAVKGRELAPAAREAVNDPATDAVIAGGGDGTVSAVAGALAGTDKPLGVLPLGTLNHFARDLGIPLDLDAAVRVIAAGRTRAVDVGEVNGRVFVNNSSLGVYPQLVHRRDEQRRESGRGKWLAMFYATLDVFRRLPVVRLRLHVGGETRFLRTPMLFVGNNVYEFNLLAPGERPALDQGQLCLYTAHARGPWSMARLALRALLGRLDQARDFEAACVPSLTIDAVRRRLDVAADGEVLTMAPPLHYRVRPGALRVLVPE